MDELSCWIPRIWVFYLIFHIYIKSKTLTVIYETDAFKKIGFRDDSQANIQPRWFPETHLIIIAYYGDHIVWNLRSVHYPKRITYEPNYIIKPSFRCHTIASELNSVKINQERNMYNKENTQWCQVILNVTYLQIWGTKVNNTIINSKLLFSINFDFPWS